MDELILKLVFMILTLEESLTYCIILYQSVTQILPAESMWNLLLNHTQCECVRVYQVYLGKIHILLCQVCQTIKHKLWSYVRFVRLSHTLWLCKCVKFVRLSNTNWLQMRLVCQINTRRLFMWMCQICRTSLKTEGELMCSRRVSYSHFYMLEEDTICQLHPRRH